MILTQPGQTSSKKNTRSLYRRSALIRPKDRIMFAVEESDDALNEVHISGKNSPVLITLVRNAHK